MQTLRLILGDQLCADISSLQGADKNNDLICFFEVFEEATYVKHHQKKIAFIFSAMRHFALELKESGFQVHYTKLDDPLNAGSFTLELERVLSIYPISRVMVTHPGEYRVLAAIKEWEKTFKINIEIRQDDRFLCDLKEFETWARGRSSLRMEFFYREMRKKHKILMQGSEPVGGKWNYDTENRKPLKNKINLPKPWVNQPDEITAEVIELVKKRFSKHFGDLEPFYFAVTRAQALQVLKHFIKERLPHYGDYQDAMIQGEPWMYHSHLSFYLNIGLLSPLECIIAVQTAYEKDRVPLNAAEGFIRQILGWREYVRGIYWMKMPEYAVKNFFKAKRALPEFYWTGDTQMNCLSQCVKETKQNAYAHHIQRLMVLGNFALIAGIDPAQVNEWFLIVYADAYEWVELPNVSGMILFADGGYLASKPYAAGGAYIHKMSNYCEGCQFQVKEKTGPNACPFNYLYWDFLMRNRKALESNPRIAMMYKTLDRMTDENKKAIKESSEVFLKKL